MTDFIPNNGVPRSLTTGVPGWLTEQEEELLCSVAALVPAGGHIVQLGCEFGRGSSVFCYCADKSVQISDIDLFPDNYPGAALDGKGGDGPLVEAYKHNLSRAGFERRTLAFKTDSGVAGKAWQFGLVNAIFVDADHSYNAALSDARIWSRHVAVGGFMLFHDCAHGEESHKLHYEVSRAVDDWLAATDAQWDELDRVHSIRMFIRMR